MESNDIIGWRVFEDRLIKVRLCLTEDNLGFDIDECLPCALQQKYKNRDVTGTLLHYSIDNDPDGDDVQTVLEAGANVNTWMTFTAFGGEARVMPIHLAAARGHVDIIKALVYATADVDAKSQHTGLPHFCPIHDSAFARRAEATFCLLQLRANPNAENISGKCPLHIVAELGDVNIAKILINARADLKHRLPNGQKATPLDLAVRNRHFPCDKLHLLAPFCHPDYEDDFFESILGICSINAPAAKVLVSTLSNDSSDDDREVAAMRTRIVEAVRVGRHGEGPSPVYRMIQLMRLSPDVAASVMNLFLLSPKVVAEAYHPLPRAANLVARSMLCINVKVHMNTMYSPACEWTYDTSQVENQYPSWHDRLAPRPRCDEYDHEVRTRVLMLPNLLDVRLFQALNAAGDHHIFTTIPVQALIECCWSRTKPVMTVNIFVEVVVVLILASWAVVGLDAFPLTAARGHDAHAPVVATSLWGWSAMEASASLLWAVALCEGSTLCHRAIMHVCWGFPPRNFLKGRHFAEAIVAGLPVAFLSACGTGHMKMTKGFFCMLMLSRWLNLLMHLRVVNGLGSEILPVVYALTPMLRFFGFAWMIYAAFFFTFLAIRSSEDIETVSEALYFATFTMDSDAFSVLRQLNGQDHEVTQMLLGSMVLAFTVFILNLMIAIFNNVYNEKVDNAAWLFQRERAIVCEQCLLQPAWPTPRSRRAGSRDYGWEGQSVHDLLGDVTGRSAKSSMTKFRSMCMDRMPYVAAAFAFVAWIVLLGASRSLFPPAPGVSSFWCSLPLVAAMMLLQAAILQNNWFNRDYHRQTPNAEEEDETGHVVRRGYWGPCLAVVAGRSRDMEPIGDGLVASIDLHDERDEDRLGESAWHHFLWVCYRYGLGADEDTLANELRERIKDLGGEVRKLCTKVSEMDDTLRKHNQLLRKGRNETLRSVARTP